jgi:carbon-monoxide dehydrogenase medium subunit
MKDGICQDVRIALGAVAPTPVRARKAEEAVRGKPLTAETIAEAARLAPTETRPISDVRSSAEYRKKIVGVYTKRALEQALARVQAGGQGIPIANSPRRFG